MSVRSLPLVRRAVASLIAAAIVVAASGAGCGKKGPPLAPVSLVPARIEPFEVRRIGDTVLAQFRVPTANQDGSSPADVARVEVWAFTGSPGAIANLYKYGTLVAAFPVRRPPDPEETPAPAVGRAEGAGQVAAEGAVPPRSEPARARRPTPRDLEPGFDQGATVTVTDPVTPQAMTLVLTPEQARLRRRPIVSLVPVPLSPPPLEVSAARIYVVVGVNRNGQRGPASPRISIPLLDPPPPPPAPEVTYTEQAIMLTWAVPAGVRQPVQKVSIVEAKTAGGEAAVAATAAEPKAAAAGGEAKPATVQKAAEPQAPASAAPPSASDSQLLPSRPIGPQVPGSAYLVSEATAAPAAIARPDLRMAVHRKALPAGAIFEGGLLVASLNEKPLEQPTYTDSRVEFGVERCYVVRTVNVFDGLRIESAPSPPTCVKLVDTFPPAAPANLAAVSGGGAISLIWEANTEADLAGYLVLRGEAPGGPLAPLTPEPIKESTFRDTSVRPGVRYVYVVVAVDTATPPNTSARTSRIEETAR